MITCCCFSTHSPHNLNASGLSLLSKSDGLCAQLRRQHFVRRALPDNVRSRLSPLIETSSGQILLGVLLMLLTQLASASAQNRPKIEFVPNPAAETVLSAAFSPDGLRLLSGGQDKTLKLWDAATGHLLRVFHDHAGGVEAVAFSPDGWRLLSGSADKTLRLWNAATGKSLRTFEGHSAAVTSAAFSPDGSRVISGSSDKTLILWDTATGQLLRRFQGHSDRVSSVAFLRDGSRVVSGSGGSLHSHFEGRDKTLKLWDATTGQLLRTFEGHSAGVTSVAVSANGALLLSGSEDRMLKLWDATTAKLLRTFQGHTGPVWSSAFSPDGARLLSGANDKTMKLWDTATGQLLRTMRADSKFDRPTSVAFSQDGTRLLWGGFGSDSLRLWDAATGQVLRSVGGRTRPVYSVAFSPDGRRLLSGNLDNTIKLWDAATGPASPYL
jgi:WD40 repeat protein